MLSCHSQHVLCWVMLCWKATLAGGLLGDGLMSDLMLVSSEHASSERGQCMVETGITIAVSDLNDLYSLPLLDFPSW